ncbi:MAG: LytTR family transcriptional regulator [Lachnospiraceae bacterium]|nr:LytTR family transcriptional regulator [Lachnospiraceae bacterium]
MRIKLRLNKTTQESIQGELTEKNIEISEESKLILTEEDYIGDNLECRDEKGIVIVNTENICYMESVGHDVYVYADNVQYKTRLRIYQLEKLLPPEQFIRISNSIIIKKNSIRHIKPALSCKFYLTLINGDVVDVTRTYYYKFKEFYGI